MSKFKDAGQGVHNCKYLVDTSFYPLEGVYNLTAFILVCHKALKETLESLK